MLISSNIQYPGPNEAGLKFLRDTAAQYPRVFGFFLTFLRPTVEVHHPDTMKIILKTSGQ